MNATNGELRQVESSFPGGTHVVNQSGVATAVAPDRRGSIAVGQPGLDACPQQVAVIDSALTNAMSTAGPSDLLPIYAVCTEQLSLGDAESLTQGLDREGCRRAILSATMSLMVSQAPALSYVSAQVALGNATTPHSTFVVNGFSTTATVAVINELASLPSLSHLYLNHSELATPATCPPPGQPFDYSICDGTQIACAPGACDTSLVSLPCQSVDEQGNPTTIFVPVPPSLNPASPAVSAALNYLGLPEVWDEFMITGRGNLALNYDNGTDYCQPSLASRYSLNLCDPVDFLDNDQNLFVDDHWGWDALGQDGDPHTEPSFPETACDRSGHNCGNAGCSIDHGTTTASCIVGTGTPYPVLGSKITGSAPGAMLRAYKGARVLDQIDGIGYAMVVGADVVSFQLVGSHNAHNDELRNAVRMAALAGITVVGPAGNGPGWRDIAAVPEAIGVGGIWESSQGSGPNFCDDTRYRHVSGPVPWGFPDTQYFTKPDLVVPAHGVAVVKGNWSCRRQTCDATGYHYAITETGGGTSLSAPIVSGLTLLLLEKNNELMPDEIRSILEITARDLGAPGKDNDFGAGVPQMDEALRSIALVNNFNHFLEVHAIQDGGMPTNWAFEVSEATETPTVSIADLTPSFDPCAINGPQPEAGLRVESPAGHRTLGYVWEPRTSHLFSFKLKFESDPSGTR